MSRGRSVVIDASALQRSGRTRGLGRYTRTLIETVQGRTVETGAEFDVSLLRLRMRAPERIDEWLSMCERTARLVPRHGALYHSTSPYNLTPIFLRKTVCSVQDIIPLDFPGYKMTGVKARYFHHMIPGCSAVVTSSSHTAGRVTKVLGTDPTKMFLAPLPVTALPAEPTEINRALPLTPFVSGLFDLATPDPRKRFDLFLDCAQQLANLSVPVVVVGAGTEKIALPGILGLGRVTDSELFSVLSASTCFLYTSAYEGQGLPPQEALASGTPVVCTPNSSLPEMLGGGAEYVEMPDDTPGALAAALTSACLQLVEDGGRRSRLTSEGLSHVKTFTPERFLSGILAAYQYASGIRGEKMH